MSSGRAELRLMAAVLEDAIRTLCRCTGSRGVHRQRLFSETADWFESPDVSWPFSFASICQALDMEPEYLRRGLQTWRERTASAGIKGQVYRFPFRRVNGRRHSINAKRERRKVRRAS